MTKTPASIAGDAPAVTANEPHQGSKPWAWLVLLVVGGVAGGLGSEAVERMRDRFQVASERLGMPPHPPAIEREMFLYALANHGIGYAVNGMLVCGLLGLALGIIGGTPMRAVGALVVGGVAGVVLGAVGGMASFLAYENLVGISLDGLFKAMLIHFPNVLLLAVGVSLAALAALPRRPAVRDLLVAAIGAAALAALLYPLLALVIFPAEASDRPVPSHMGLRVLCFALGGGALGIASARSSTPS